MRIYEPGGCSAGSRAWKGFTLVEVILSVTIFVVGVIAVQRTLVSSLSVMSMIENWDQAEGLLQEQIWEVKRSVREGNQGKRLSTQHSVLLGRNRTFNYDQTVRAIDAKASLLEVSAKISWEGKGIQHALPRVFYVRIPDAKKTTRL